MALAGCAAWFVSWLLAVAATAQSIPLRYYAHEQGLLGLAGTCLLQTPRTPLWVCTESGLYRFDGREFRQVALDGERNLHVSSISQDPAGRIWVGSLDNLFVGDERGFRKLDHGEIGRLRRDSLQLASTRWATLLVNANRVQRVVAQPQGRWRLQPLFDEATITRRPELGQIASAFADDDTLWLGCARMLCRVDAAGNVETLGPAQGVPEDIWYSVAHDRDDGLWVRGRRHVIQRPAGARQFELRPLPMPAPATIGRPADIAVDHQGRILVRDASALARWEDGHWRLFDHRNGLPESSSSALLVDRGGDLWLNMDGESLVRWAGYGRIENWDASQGMVAAPTWSILRDANGGLLVGNEHGISRQPPSGGRFQPWLAAAGIQVIGLQRAADGTLWSVNSAGHLFRHAADGSASQEIARLPHTVRRLFLDRQQRLWIPTTAGLYLLEDPQAGGTPQRVADLPEISYQDISQDATGTLWLAGADGLYRLREGRWMPMMLSVDGRQVHDWVSKVRVDAHGEVWLAFYRPGLWHGQLRGDRVELRRSADPAFAELTVYVIHVDHAGRLWIGHNRGVDVRMDGRWSRLSQSQGLLWDDTSEGAILEDPDGSIWLGNSKGVSHILDPARLFDNTVPRLEITDIRRGDERIVPGARLPWNDRPLHVELTALGIYDDPNRARFRFRLTGLHREWVYVRNGEIEPPPLPAGRYVFEAQLLDDYRRSASVPARIAFEVAPHWWAGWPARVVYTLLAAGLAVGIWRWRLRGLLIRERTLKRLVAERTVELEREKRELESARAALALKASHDELTGLLNRAGILDALAVAMNAAQANGQPLAVVLIDLDHFKQINDQYGHLTGDGVLARVGRRLNIGLRDSDRIGRYGGEELLAILPGLVRPARERLQLLLEAIRATPYGVNGQTLVVTCSIGVAWYREGESAEQLLGRADEALYRAKRNGRDRIELEL
ncbi:MAG: diguanylate cyclase [Pseudomonas sp.]